MANFNTHLSIALIGSGSTALLAINSQLINWFEAPWLTLLGTIGGLLPDIDSDNTRQVRILFFSLGIMSTLILLSEGSILQGIPSLLPSDKVICHASALEFSSMLSELSNQCLPYSLILVAFSSFFIVRYGLLAIFKSLTVHRGVFHSLLAAAFFALSTTCISYYFLKQDPLFSWLSGCFIAVGFIIHLLLDEIYSVDLSNARLKRSFGTALKIYGYRSPFSSLLMLLCTLYLYTLSPSPNPFIDAIKTASNHIYSKPKAPKDTVSQPTWIDYLRSNLKENKPAKDLS